MTKICTKCKQEKPTNAEYFNRHKNGFQSWCKVCKAEYHLKNREERNRKMMERYRKLNPLPEALPEGTKRCSACEEIKSVDNFGKLKSAKDGLRGQCKDCRKKEYEKNREEKIKKSRERYHANKKVIGIKNKQYKKDNQDYYKQKYKDYYQKHKEKIKQRSKEYLYKRIDEDPAFKILQRCRARLYKAIKGKTKTKRTKDLIGCSPEYLLQHLESQFQDGMTWDNYGEWHIDHIRPCASFDFTDEKQQKECFNYRNLQPLWAENNFSKSAKIESG